MGLIQDVADLKATIAALPTSASPDLTARVAAVEAEIAKLNDVLYGPVMAAEPPVLVEPPA